ncbi:protein KAKU4-like [Bidens hawaiensis]|uniref:protein KAKU4-like n=1 Tax=Bidens hawaiensis TaxID=980011 RepID=UPI00404A7BD6
MASDSGRSGGKILKQKRIAARNTPYDRPTPSQPQQLPEESPSWLTGLVSPAKFVAGGASKIISSIWNPKTWSARSSDSDVDSDDESGDEENPLDGVLELSEQKPYQKSELLHYIEQLLLFEHFTREECDRLIEIINSRVVDNSNDAGPSMIHGSTNNETSDTHNQAILEAKKWVAENKVRSGLRSDLDNGIFALKSVMTPQATEKEAGSPVDVAKSNMKSRPPWASPINNDKLLTTPSPLAADLFKEKTPFSSTGGLSFSSAKKDYLSARSWNIQEELRRVRTKATEDLLNSQRSLKLALSANETSIIAAGRNEPFKSVDEVVSLAAEGSDPILSDMMTSQKNLAPEALHSHPAMPDLEQYKGINQNGLEKDQDTTQPDDRNLGHENNSSAKDIAQADNNCFFMTESPDIPTVSNSQDSFNNTNDQSQTTKKKEEITENQAVTRASRSTRRAKGRGK